MREPADIEAIARTAYAALNRGDLDAFIDSVHPEVEFTSLIAESEGQTFHGHDGVRRWWRDVARSLGGLHFELTRMVPHGDRGYSELTVTGHVGGVEVPQRMWQAVRLRDGKAIWWQTCRSEEEARRILGLEA